MNVSGMAAAIDWLRCAIVGGESPPLRGIIHLWVNSIENIIPHPIKTL
jgi:hypothetical protein